MQQPQHITGQKKISSRVSKTLESFDSLPDAANVRVGVAAALFDCHPDSIWRWAKQGRLTALKIGPKVTAFNVGEIRRLLSAA